MISSTSFTGLASVKPTTRYQRMMSRQKTHAESAILLGSRTPKEKMVVDPSIIRLSRAERRAYFQRQKNWEENRSEIARLRNIRKDSFHIRYTDMDRLYRINPLREERWGRFNRKLHALWREESLLNGKRIKFTNEEYQRIQKMNHRLRQYNSQAGSVLTPIRTLN